VVLTCISLASSSQRVRSNLYGALLNYMRIGKAEKADGANLPSAKNEFRKANLEVLQEFGENFLDTLCRDTVSGHDIRRMLALSVLVELVALDDRGGWTFYMSNQGYLRHIVESMAVEDEALARLLGPEDGAEAESAGMRALYAFETKMALLTQLASTAGGAELLLETGLMLRLSEMSVFSARPDMTGAPAEDQHDQLFTPLDRYHQVLFPALHLCQAIMASLGPGNVSVAAQIQHFIISNEELVNAVLRRQGQWNLGQLHELSLLTGLIANSAAVVFTSESSSAAELEAAAHVTRVQRLILSLVPIMAKAVSAPESEALAKVPVKERFRAGALLLEIAANVVTFLRQLVDKEESARLTQVVFAPSLAEARDANDDGKRFECFNVQ